ncbi:MAG: ATP-binding cassette domain-containing protein [Candidatus Eisenbacteria bacterium]|nr:ATP-binding cassette domain-containing protein [Candidatus Eisenbacteria bacterium]
MIAVDGLTKTYRDSKRGEVRAVDGVSFRCTEKEVFGILGPNGAGKTTTLRVLATIIRPDAGQALLNGWSVEREPEQVRASIGYLSGETGLYGRLSPREILRYFGRLNRFPADRLEERIESLVALFEMGEFADTRCEKLSTGMRQKVSIARAVVHDPPILIFDEPTAGLDILVADALLTYIEECRNQGKCVVFSTHVMSEAERLCDRIAVIHRGRILAVGSLEDLRRETGERFLEKIFLSLVRGERVS